MQLSVSLKTAISLRARVWTLSLSPRYVGGIDEEAIREMHASFIATFFAIPLAWSEEVRLLICVPRMLMALS